MSDQPAAQLAAPVRDEHGLWWACDPAGHWHAIPVPPRFRQASTGYQGWFWAAGIVSVLGVLAAFSSLLFTGAGLVLTMVAVVCAVIGGAEGVRCAVHGR